MGDAFNKWQKRAAEASKAYRRGVQRYRLFSRCDGCQKVKKGLTHSPIDNLSLCDECAVVRGTRGPAH